MEAPALIAKMHDTFRAMMNQGASWELTRTMAHDAGLATCLLSPRDDEGRKLPYWSDRVPSSSSVRYVKRPAVGVIGFTRVYL